MITTLAGGPSTIDSSAAPARIKRPQHRVDPGQGPVAGQGLHQQRVDDILTPDRLPHQAAEQRHFGVGDTAVLEPVLALQVAEPMANELIDHRFRVITSLLGLKQCLHGSDP